MRGEVQPRGQPFGGSKLPSQFSQFVEQEVELPHRNSASATHVFLGWLIIDRAIGGAENAGRENDGREIDGPMCRA